MMYVAPFVDAWRHALRGAIFVPIPSAEQERFLTILSERIIGALTAEPPDGNVGYPIGVEMVEKGFSTPETLARTMTTMRRMLPELVGHDERRLTAFMESFTTGFAQAMIDRCLDGQEAVRLAALTATADAQKALRDSEARFRDFATHDQFTGLPNRTRLVERLAEVVESGRHLAVFSIDLDEFGKVNDTFGYRVGDRVLLETADRLRELAATIEHCEVFRLDRDEFVMLLGDIETPDEAEAMADRAAATLAEPYLIDDYDLPITAGVGILETITTNVELGEMLRMAQVALHWAKADGPGCRRVYRSDRSAEDARRFRLSAAMPSALRRGEFTLAYQPLVNLRDGRLVGVEALARWDHPSMGLLAAGQFIGLAEATGIVVAMDDYLMEQACREAERWVHLCSEPPYVAVNLAARQLKRPGLVARVSEVLSGTGLPPENLQLEITEHGAPGTDQHVVDTLRELTALGVHVAIDDFGTGYSNLASLSRLPVHALKLDGAFASHSLSKSESTDREFISTLVDMGHTLGLEVVAEGIESLWQARRMRDAGCDLGQGYLFGAPGPAKEIERLLVEGRSHVLGPAARPQASLMSLAESSRSDAWAI